MGGGSALGLILAQLEAISAQLVALDGRVAKAERTLAALTPAPAPAPARDDTGGAAD